MGSGGKERRITELLKELVHHHDINFELVIMSNDIHYNEVTDLGIIIHKIIRKNKKDISIFNQIYKICKNFKPDIVHSWDSMSAIYSIPSCRLQNIKFINGMVVDTPVRQNLLNKYWLRARITFPFSDFIVGNSDAGLRAYVAPVGRRVLIYNGFNFERLTDVVPSEIIKNELNIKSGYVIGMVAAFSERKDYRTYFKAAHLLLKKRRDITFLAIGANTDTIKSEDLIDHQFITNFRLLGKRNKIESYINVMDICVLATYTEGISNSIMEYMALGKPVIATSGGGTNEILLDNETGFLISHSKPEELAEKAEILLYDDKLRQRMGQAGKKRIKEKFSIDNMVNKFIDLYKRSLHNS